MKIGFVFDDSLDRPDGIQQYLMALGPWLAERGHQVHYLVGETRTRPLPNIHSLSRNIGVTYNGNQLRIPLPAKRGAIKAVLERESFDILHVMVPYSPMLAAKVIHSAPATTAIFGTFHILPQTAAVRWSTRLLGLWLHKSARAFDKMYAVSPAAKSFAQETFGFKEVEVLPNVTDVSRFANGVPFERYTDAIPTIVFLGRLVPRKGCATLVAAIAELKSRGVWPLRLVVCGKGPLLAELQHRAQQTNIADAVEFTGFISEEDKPRYLASAGIAVFPSLGGESFGIVLIEAMASGRPVVLAASNPGYASVMDARPQQMFKPGDSVGLADTIARHLASATDRTNALEWQKAYIPQFDIAAVGMTLENDYLQQLQKKQLA